MENMMLSLVAWANLKHQQHEEEEEEGEKGRA
jgi:hypothetical protein